MKQVNEVNELKQQFEFYTTISFKNRNLFIENYVFNVVLVKVIKSRRHKAAF